MSMKNDARRDMGTYGEFAEECEHGRAGYCFDCVRKRHNQEMLDGKFDDADDDYASTPHPSAYYNNDDERG